MIEKQEEEENTVLLSIAKIAQYPLGELIDLVKASITGSILANVLFIFGIALIAGGLKSKDQFFNREDAGLQTSMLFIATIALTRPAVSSNTILKELNVRNQIKIQTVSNLLG